MSASHILYTQRKYLGLVDQRRRLRTNTNPIWRQVRIVVLLLQCHTPLQTIREPRRMYYIDVVEHGKVVFLPGGRGGDEMCNLLREVRMIRGSVLYAPHLDPFPLRNYSAFTMLIFLPSTLNLPHTQSSPSGIPVTEIFNSNSAGNLCSLSNSWMLTSSPLSHCLYMASTHFGARTLTSLRIRATY